MAKRVRVPWSVRWPQIAELLEQGERRGRSLRETARGAGLPLAALYGWRKRLRSEAAAAIRPRARPRAGFVELVAESSLTPARAATSGSAIELLSELGVRIRVSDGFDAALLRRVIAALSS